MKYLVLVYSLLLTLLLLPFSGYQCRAQKTSTISLQGSLQRISAGYVNGNEIVQGYSIPRTAVKGTHYLDDTWNLSSLLLTDNTTLEGYYMKFDIEKNEFNVLGALNLVKVLDGNLVDSFVWKDSVDAQPHSFINSFRLINSDLTGFTEVLNPGGQQLLKNTVIIFRDANYNVALDVGDKSVRLIKKSNHYLIKDDHVTEVKNWKDIISLQKEVKVRDDAEAYAKQIKASKDERDMVKIVNFINTLNPK